MLSGQLVDRVRHRLAAAGAAVTPSAVAAAVRAESDGVLADLQVLSALRELQQELVGAGPLEPLLADPDTTDVLVNAPEEVWVEQAGELRRTEVRFADTDAVRRLAQRLALAAGRRLDDASPYVDAPLPGGVRLHAVLAPVATGCTCISLRVLRPTTHGLDALQEVGSVSPEAGGLLRAIVAARLAFLVVGGTGSGKTTLLAALLGCVPAGERIVCVEEAPELAPGHPHVVRLTARQPNVEGAGEVTLRDLVRQALRMRPDRLVVGEVRGAEVCELLAALNTGHQGGAGTLHANSPAEVPARLEALAALGGMARHALHSQLAAAVHVVLHVVRRDGARRLAAVGVLERDDDLVRVLPAWQDGRWGPGRRRLHDLLYGAHLVGSADGQGGGVAC
ncbi:MAG: TadA family conjugal transfer-associated ATPase [Pseudonocardiales bacterium]|nr:TadA family conjugal transfer-associated ATPase [Pseudonocardiales bacterium]MBV9030145.1 TadA family conjugal transfer-associated ATPase [Pseudonocardiales bacterium]MBW0010702.1 TadA family conjugal transfer-associated ATPase [Pseudonocardiales bacterium]